MINKYTVDGTFDFQLVNPLQILFLSAFKMIVLLSCNVKINGSIFSMLISPPSRSHCFWLIVIFPFVFFRLLSQKLTMTQLELCKAKNGTAGFFKWHKFVSLYLALMSPAWEQREGRQLWWDDLVWIKSVSQQAPQGLSLFSACLLDSHPHDQPVLRYISSFPLFSLRSSQWNVTKKQ